MRGNIKKKMCQQCKIRARSSKIDPRIKVFARLTSLVWQFLGSKKSFSGLFQSSRVVEEVFGIFLAY